MERTHGPEITFTVHPRPEREEFIGHADPMPMPVGIKPAPSFSMPKGPDLGDTLIGNLIFHARFAFGRY